MPSRCVVLAWCAAAALACARAADAAAATDRQVAWLREHAIPLRTIDPASDDFSDLEPLRQALAGRRVVILGEASHGDGSVFTAKARLVRFLHREMGFDVLAFESGAYDCWRAWQSVRTGGDPEQAFRDAVFRIWTRSAQVQPLIADFAAAARSPRPLELAGFDPQFTGPLSARWLLDDLARVATAVGMDASELSGRLVGPLANLTEGKYESGELPTPAEREAFLGALDDLRRRLEARANTAAGDAAGVEAAVRPDAAAAAPAGSPPAAAVPDPAFWARIVTLTRELAVSSWATDWTRELREQPTYVVRDRLMGEQLAWLATERYAGRKMIVWMHSGHAFRNVDRIDVPSKLHMDLYRTLRPAGWVARDTLGDELYVMGTLAWQGAYGFYFRPAESLLVPSPGSLEDLLHRTGRHYAFLDLASRSDLPHWLRDPLVARPIGYKEMKARWPEVFDGFLFVDWMEPSRRLADDPATAPAPSN